MKTFRFIFVFVLALPAFGLKSVAQVEIKGSGTTGSTMTLITKNASSDTSMIVRDDGMIGIGTTNPLTKLDVNGVINARSGVRFPGGIIQTLAYTGPPVAAANRFTVALSGGDFTAISAAIAACIAPGPGNPYLIEVMPGTYTEPAIICVAYVSLRGAGKYASTIQAPITTANNMVIDGFTITQPIQCPSVSPTITNNIINTGLMPAGADGINVVGPAQPRIAENEITGCTGYGIRCNAINANPWIIDNRITLNTMGGIRIEQCSPVITNNFIDNNSMYGIYILGGGIAIQTMPVISGNLISNTSFMAGGVGIWMANYTTARITSNDIFMNAIGITINLFAQPYILGNNISYNASTGIACFSNGTNSRVVITGNHIHHNISFPAAFPSGIWVGNCNPVITLNNITQNNVAPVAGFPDINYGTCVVPNFPTISSNIYDMIVRPGGGPGPGPAGGMYNTTVLGLPINP